MLFYGDYPRMAKRCLESILRSADPLVIKEFRIGLNDVCEETRSLVVGHLAAQDIPARIYEPERNVMKYPLMRRMFYDSHQPVETIYLMWFDDDSCLAPQTDRTWWLRVVSKLADADMLGHIWVQHTHGNQRVGIQAQPWYAGKSMTARHKFKFATGGWWAARREVVFGWNYPWPALHHNGGDTTLGEMLRQQGQRLVEFKEGLWINADDRGRPSLAKRRGVHTKPVWHDYNPDVPIPDLSHHVFDIKIYDPKGQSVAY